MLMSRHSSTRIIIVVGVLVVGSFALLARTQFASHGPAAGKASDSPPSASPFPGETGSTATLDAGRYVTSDPFPVPVSATVPAGWKSHMGGPYAVFLSTADGDGNAGPAVLALLLSPLVYADPCQDRLPGSPSASVDDFVRAVAALRGLTVTGPKDVTVGGLQGRQVTVTASSHGVGCTGDDDLVMTLPLGHRFGLKPGETMTLTAIDDSGVLLIVEEETTPKATAQDRAQLGAVLVSMSIGGST